MGTIYRYELISDPSNNFVYRTAVDAGLDARSNWRRVTITDPAPALEAQVIADTARRQTELASIERGYRDRLPRVDASRLVVEGGAELESTADGGLDTSDSTSRLTVESFQTNGAHFYGEGIRLDLMRSMAKNMIAWRLPRPVTSGDPETTMRSVTWIGSHWYAQDQPDPDNPTVIHGHWSIEVPDSEDHLQTRLEIKFADENGVLGVDKTLVQVENADLVVDCSAEAVLRLRTGAGAVKAVEFANDQWGHLPRWQIRQNGTAESGSNVGSDFEVGRYSDAGSTTGIPLSIARNTGRVTFGGADGSQSGITVNRNGSGQAMTVNGLAAGVTGYALVAASGDSATARLAQASVTGEAGVRYVQYASGKQEWGDGTNARDVNVYRGAADVLATDDTIAVMTAGAGLRVKEGSNAKQGTATLVGGTVTVTNSAVTANSRIFLTTNTPGGTVGTPYISARSAGTSFTITSTSGSDTSTVAYQIFEPA